MSLEKGNQEISVEMLLSKMKEIKLCLLEICENEYLTVSQLKKAVEYLLKRYFS